MPAAAIAIPAILGAVGVGGSIFSGITGAKAATSAAQIQQQAAQKAGDQVIQSAKDINPLITSAADIAGSGVTRAAGDAGAGVASATDRANALVDPYRLSGYDANTELTNGLVAGGDFNRTPTAADITLDPGFANRLKYDQIGLERSSAARGGASSGTALMDLSRFSQREASTEYDKAFQRFREGIGDRFSRLNAVAGRGADVAGVEGNRLVDSGKYSGDAIRDAAKYQGDKTYNAAVDTGNRTFDASRLGADYLTQGANAEAAGKVARANAITGAISSGVSAVGGAAGIYSQLKTGYNPLRGRSVINRNPAPSDLARAA